MTSPLDYLRQLDAVDANLRRLDSLWGEISALLPSASQIGGAADEARYEDLARKFGKILAVMPAIEGRKMESCIPDARSLLQTTIDYHEIGEPEALASLHHLLTAQGDDLEAYRRAFEDLRRERSRDGIRWLRHEMDRLLDVASPMAPEHLAAQVDEVFDGVELCARSLGHLPVGWREVRSSVQDAHDRTGRDRLARLWDEVAPRPEALVEDPDAPLQIHLSDLRTERAPLTEPPLPPPPAADDLSEAVERLKNILIARATGEAADEADYKRLRKLLIAHPDLGPRLPRFVRTASTTGEFWGFIKEEAKSYADRRRIISEAFASILDDLATGDVATSAVYERIDPPIGEGGFGVVWKYRHRLLDIPFAFKVFAPAFSEGGGSDLDRFFREARILFKLRHPDIVQIFDVGMMGRRPFIRMEFCEGETLNAVLRRVGRVPPANARRLVRRLAGALEHAHDLGVVHRDLKPSNVMIGPKDTRSIRLIDFGLGVFVEKDIVSRLTKTGEAVAGGHYTAPELLANPKLIDPRTDLYSLGAVWYEMLTGRPPVGAGVHAALDGVGDLTASDRALVLRCLADLGERPSAAGAVLSGIPE